MTPERLAIKERLAAETKARMDAVWNSPGFADEHAAWLNEHRAAAEMCKAREKAGMTQAALILAVSIFTHLVKPLFVKRKVISEHTRQTNRFSLCLCASCL